MSLLLDTHLMLWAMQGRAALPAAAQRRMDGSEPVYVSAVSLWEAAIKVALGKLKVDLVTLEQRLADAGFLQLPVRWAHGVQVGSLPMHHRDPFDRLLVAQAICEPMRLLTCDAVLPQYSELVTLV